MLRATETEVKRRSDGLKFLSRRMLMQPDFSWRGEMTDVTQAIEMRLQEATFSKIVFVFDLCFRSGDLRGAVS